MGEIANSMQRLVTVINSSREARAASEKARAASERARVEAARRDAEQRKSTVRDRRDAVKAMLAEVAADMRSAREAWARVKKSR